MSDNPLVECCVNSTISIGLKKTFDKILTGLVGHHRFPVTSQAKVSFLLDVLRCTVGVQVFRNKTLLNEPWGIASLVSL